MSSLEPTNEQAIALALATGLGETRGMHVAMLLWPLVRDMVLEEAAKEIASWGCSYDDHADSVREVAERAMKRQP